MTSKRQFGLFPKGGEQQRPAPHRTQLTGGSAANFVDAQQSQVGQLVLLGVAVGIVDDLRKLAPAVTPPSVRRVVAPDPDDDQVLACAPAAGADLIVSGDRRDLQPLGSDHGIPIITAREAVGRVNI
jgi:hypothetical protein